MHGGMFLTTKFLQTTAEYMVKKLVKFWTGSLVVW